MDGQVIQLEDGSAAYVQHVPMTKSSKCNYIYEYILKYFITDRY